MPAFLDASVFVKFYFPEAGSEEIIRLIDGGEEVWLSELTGIEIAAALAKKVREQDLKQEHFPDLLGKISHDLATGRFGIVTIDDEVKGMAKNLLSTWALQHPLRTLDALQLASALKMRSQKPELEWEFYVSDRTLAAAAEGHGLVTCRVGIP